MKVLQSNLFCKIRSDPRNNLEFQRMLADNLKGVYHFYVDDELVEFKTKVVGRYEQRD